MTPVPTQRNGEPLRPQTLHTSSSASFASRALRAVICASVGKSVTLADQDSSSGSKYALPIVTFAACTAARIGEVSGVRAGDIDRATWPWTVRRQTTPGPGGLIDKGTK